MTPDYDGMPLWLPTDRTYAFILGAVTGIGLGVVATMIALLFGVLP